MNSEVIFGQLESEMEMRFSGKIVDHTEKTTFSSPIPMLNRHSDSFIAKSCQIFGTRIFLEV